MPKEPSKTRVCINISDASYKKFDRVMNPYIDLMLKHVL
ncbi:MAG: hypothetical protein K0R24_1442 [Gammaproteobacteria bacterium]|jgi:hypothetical protein|nr:hypothetical protein [Gammaproteobacteria bacterium]